MNFEWRVIEQRLPSKLRDARVFSMTGARQEEHKPFCVFIRRPRSTKSQRRSTT
jgi:hypothetical protein